MSQPLTSAITAGSELDLGAFVDLHYERLLRLARLVSRDVGDAADAVQIALEQAWRARSSLREPERLRPWLDRIVVREAIRIDRRHRGLLGFFQPIRSIELAEPSDPRADLMPDWSAMRTAFARLSAEQRAVIALHLHAGYSVAETAAIVGAPEETVRSRLRLAKERLRRDLEVSPMSQVSRSNDFDETLRSFLARQSEAVAGAPTADEMKRRLVERASTGRAPLARSAPRLRLAWAVAILAVLIALLLASSAFFGKPLFNVAPPPPTASPSIAPTASASETSLGYLDGSITAGDSFGNLVALNASNGGPPVLVQCQSPCTQLASPAWSPDGRFLAYTLKAPGNTGGAVDAGQGIWVRDMAAGTSRQLLACGFGSTCQLDGPMAWSPDGTRIALFQGFDLASLSVADGAVSVVKHHDTALDPQFLTFDVAWMPGGQSLLYVMDNGRGIVDLDGTNDRALPDLPSGFVGGMSPDGTRVAYVTDIETPVGSPPATPAGDPSTAQLWVANLDGSNPRVVAQFPGCCLGAWVGSAAWSADSRQLAWAGWNSAAGDTDVIVANADGSGSHLLGVQVGALRPAWYPQAAPPRPEPSAGVPVTRTGPTSPSGCAPLDGMAQNSVAVDLGSAAAAAGLAPAGAPSNGVVAVASLGANGIDSYLSVVPWQGGKQTVLMAISSTGGRAFPNHLAWSPDGRRIAFSVADGLSGDGQGFSDSAFTCEDLFSASADGTQLNRLTFSTTGHGATIPAWSPDGHQLAYLAYAGTAADDTGSWPPPIRELHILDLVTGSDRDVAPCGSCDDMAWSPDGRTIAAIDSLHDGLILVDVAGGIGTRALAQKGVAAFRWAADGTSMLVLGTTPPVAYPVDLTRTGAGGGPRIGPERVIVPTGTWVFSPGDIALDSRGQHMLGLVQRYDTGLPTVVNVDVSLERPTTVPLEALTNSHSVSYVWSPDGGVALVQAAGEKSVFTIDVSNAVQGPDLSTYAIQGPGRLAWQPTWP